MDKQEFITKISQWLPNQCPNSRWDLIKSSEGDDIAEAVVVCKMIITTYSYQVSLKATVNNDENAIREQVVSLNQTLYDIQDSLTASLTK